MPRKGKSVVEVAAAKMAPAAELIVPADEAAWLALRASGIGASEVAGALGVSRWLTRFALWRRKRDAIEGRTPSDPGSRAMRVGRREEPIVAEEYALDSGRRVLELPPFAVFRSKAHPFLVATPDRFQYREGREDVGLLELKRTDGIHMREWDRRAPLEYRYQVHAQMLVTGIGWATLAALVGLGHVRWLDEEPREDVAEALLHGCAAFWRSVVDDIEPAPRAEDDGLVKARFLERRVPSVVIDVGEPVAKAIAAYRIAARAESEAKRVKAKARAEILQVLAAGGASAGKLPDGRMIETKTAETPAHEVAASTRVILDLPEENGEADPGAEPVAD